MFFKSSYKSPIGNILLVSDEKYLIGLLIEKQKDNLPILSDSIIENDDIEILIRTKNWLDRYFNGQRPAIPELDLAPIGNEFRQCVWKILSEIPYGNTITYGEIAKRVARIFNKEKMSAQAIGNAIGNNPISIIIPCHRVVGKDGNLTGYAGGIDKKIELLKIENVNMTNLYLPKGSKQ